jgi:heat shock protein HtpX
MVALFVVVGALVGQIFASDWVAGAAVFLLASLVLNTFSWLFSDKLALWSMRARIVAPEDSPRLARIVQELAARDGLPMPRLAIIPSAQPNAMATGRGPRRSVVAATEGILAMLDDDELRGVLAHEMSHVKNRDVLTMSIAATLAGAITFAGRGALWGGMMGGSGGRRGNPLSALLVALLAPVAAMLVQLAISRQREFGADASGARLVGDPLPLARALAKIDAGAQARPLGVGKPTQAHLFVVNPFRGGGLAALFRTHPDTAERIRRLEAMADQAGSPRLGGAFGRWRARGA